MPPHHPIFGHLFFFANVMSKLPKDAHPHYLPDQLRRKFPKLGPIYYLDGWPFMTLTLVVTSPATLQQITTDHVLPKFPAIGDFLYPLANGKDLVSMDGRKWKYWRTILNPDFSAGHLMDLVPEMVKVTAVFCDILLNHAKTQRVFPMKHLTDHLAMDISGKIVLPLERDRSESVVDLALAAYLNHNNSSTVTEGIDPAFKEVTLNQLKLFLFSGHDTTSSTVCYVLYMLSVNPEIRSCIRAEHDEILGAEPSQAARRLSESPQLLNKLPYTTAVIKESMRLFPAASTTNGEPSFTITDPRNGLKHPAEPGLLIWLVLHACQRDPAFWPRSEEFLPERWLAHEGEELHVQRGAWRPFVM
ncbi:MAG: hypothetical protein Q9212_003499 [Teloschistes hypoglaucus]